MTPADLHAIGAFLYGGGWQTALADALRVNLRTVQRWVSGAVVPPPGAQAEIVDLVAAKQMERVTEVLAMVSREQGSPPAEITLRVSGCDSKVMSPHRREWTEATDRLINERLALLLTEAGIPARVE